MSIQLVIAEKPSVARSIAGVIGADQKRDGYMEGNGYLVSWCMEKKRRQWKEQQEREKEQQEALELPAASTEKGERIA